MFTRPLLSLRANGSQRMADSLHVGVPFQRAAEAGTLAPTVTLSPQPPSPSGIPTVRITVPIQPERTGESGAARHSD